MTSITLKDGVGANLSVGVHPDANGNIAVGQVPLVSGAPVAGDNPMPIEVAALPLPSGAATAAAQAATNAALGAVEDAEAAGDGGVIALLKRLRTLLGGVLTVSGSAAVGIAPVDPPLSVSGVDGGGLKRHLLTDTAGTLQVADAQNAAITGAAILTVGAADTTAGRMLWINATAAGDVTVKLANGTSLMIPVNVGPQAYPFAVLAVTASTATAIYANLR